MDIFYYADYYALGILAILETVFIIQAVRGGTHGRRLAGAFAYFLGSFITVAMAFHNAEIAWRIIPGTPVSHGTKPHYDFRFYALMLLGTVMIVQGVALMKAARELAFGDETARARLFRHTLILLALSVPMIPIHVFASLTTILGVLTLATAAIFARSKAPGENRDALPSNALVQAK